MVPYDAYIMTNLERNLIDGEIFLSINWPSCILLCSTSEALFMAKKLSIVHDMNLIRNSKYGVSCLLSN